LSTVLPHFAVDKEGLAKLLERRGKAFAITELIQNAWDQNVSRVDVLLTRVKNTPFVRVVVEDDDPDGFHDLAHAYTLFAESVKKNDPELRGRFNLGEKLVIALCRKATIATTKGTVAFTDEGRVMGRRKRERGSLFTGVLRMTDAELRETERVVRSLLAPRGFVTTFNGEALYSREPMTEFIATLPTERADAQGYLRVTKRQTMVEVYEPREDETPTLYELGIPVVETGDRWHVNVMQKVPLNTDRDNVKPSYLRDLRAHVLNETAILLTKEDAAEKWVDDALADDLVEPEAVALALDLRYGEKRVIFDPSDTEANRIAASRGYTVIPGNSLSKAAWGNVRAAQAAKPAGQVTPSPRPFHPGAPPLKTIPEREWTDAMKVTVHYAQKFGKEVLGFAPMVTLANDSGWPFAAAYGSRRLTLNLARVHYGVPGNEDFDDLLIHEFAHEFGSHLSSQYDKALSRLGAKAIQAARRGAL
jgi:hypothetical protein